jgi:hypothetical protein
LKTFIDPLNQKSSVKSVAVFQMRNSSFSPGETMGMDRDVTQAFSQKNTSVQLMGSDKSARKLNDENLAREYAQFLRDFETSGIPNSTLMQFYREHYMKSSKMKGWLVKRLKHF